MNLLCSKALYIILTCDSTGRLLIKMAGWVVLVSILVNFRAEVRVTRNRYIVALESRNLQFIGNHFPTLAALNNGNPSVQLTIMNITALIHLWLARSTVVASVCHLMVDCSVFSVQWGGCDHRWSSAAAGAAGAGGAGGAGPGGGRMSHSRHMALSRAASGSVWTPVGSSAWAGGHCPHLPVPGNQRTNKRTLINTPQTTTIHPKADIITVVGIPSAAHRLWAAACINGD